MEIFQLHGLVCRINDTEVYTSCSYAEGNEKIVDSDVMQEAQAALAPAGWHNLGIYFDEFERNNLRLNPIVSFVHGRLKMKTHQENSEGV